MKTLNTLNNGLTQIDGILNTQKANKAIGISEAIKVIALAIDDAKKQYGMNNRKTRKLVKNRVLGDLESDTNKSILRAYNIAFTIINRNVDVKLALLTVAQVENLVNYGTTAKINQLADVDDVQYSTDVVDYLKSIKTRVVTSKTFEKKSKV